MGNAHLCPRRAEVHYQVLASFKLTNKPEDGTCDFCGSLMPDTFMQRIEAGTVLLEPSDKTYKVYVKNDGGEPFFQSFRTDKPSKPGEIMKDPADQSLWTWATRQMQETKFYFQHLTVEQRKRFVQLLNERKLKIGWPGHFTVLPFFIKPNSPDGSSQSTPEQPTLDQPSPTPDNE